MKRLLSGILLFGLMAGSLYAGPLYALDECSVTASGWVHSSELGSFQATLTVTGPCDSSLADSMRQVIAELRAAFK